MKRIALLHPSSFILHPSTFIHLILLSWLFAACGRAPVSIPLAPTSSLAPSPTAAPTLAPSQTPTLAPTPTHTSTPTQTPSPTVTPTPIADQPGALYICQQLDESALSKDLPSANDGANSACIPAPQIEGLTTQVAPGDSGSVQYVDPNGIVILWASAVQLKDSGDPESLPGMLHSLYWANGPYYPGDTYPRFRFPVAGIQASFFALDKTLNSYMQMLLVNETLTLITGEKFIAIRENFLNAGTSFIFLPSLGSGIDGLSIAGSNTILLDRQNLSKNKFYMAATIAHEGVHVMQGRLPAGSGCREQLRREVGNKMIPKDFVNWSGDQVIAGIKNGQFGAYHLSYWMLANLGIKNLENLRQLILTGTFDGQPLILCDAGR